MVYFPYHRGGPEVSDHFQRVPMIEVSATSTKMRRLSTIDKAIRSLLKCLQRNLCTKSHLGQMHAAKPEPIS